MLEKSEKKYDRQIWLAKDFAKSLLRPFKNGFRPHSIPFHRTMIKLIRNIVMIGIVLGMTISVIEHEINITHEDYSGSTYRHNRQNNWDEASIPMIKKGDTLISLLPFPDECFSVYNCGSPSLDNKTFTVNQAFDIEVAIAQVILILLIGIAMYILQIIFRKIMWIKTRYRRKPNLRYKPLLHFAWRENDENIKSYLKGGPYKKPHWYIRFFEAFNL